MQMHLHFRKLTAGSGNSVRPKPVEISDDEVEASLELHLRELDAVGTDVQILSPRPWSIPTGDRRGDLVMDIAQQANDMIARIVKLHPDRFVGMAALPQTAGVSPSFGVEELQRCVDELGFVGCKINPDPGEGALETAHMGDEIWYPLYEKMTELDVPGLIHGGPYRFSREPELGYFITEEAVAAFGILRTPKVFHDFPNLKLIVGHGGGYLPYQVGRARAFRMNAQRRDESLEGFDESMRRLYYDTVLYNEESLELLIKVVGADRCIFGSDRPANGSVVDPVTQRALNDIKPMIDGIERLTDRDRKAIFEDNAMKIFTRLSMTAAVA
jgi:4-oxalmesaconate hydratase